MKKVGFICPRTLFVLGVLLSPLPAQAEKGTRSGSVPQPESFLHVENLRITGGNVLEFDLLNVEKRAITAWTVELRAVVDGSPWRQWWSQDFAINADPEIGFLRRSPEGQHETGMLRPGEFHRHSQTLHGRSTDPEVIVTTLILADRRVVGEREYADSIFEDRAEMRRELARTLAYLTQAREDRNIADALEELRKDHLFGETKAGPPDADVLRRLITDAGLTAEEILDAVIDLLQTQHDSLVTHSRRN